MTGLAEVLRGLAARDGVQGALLLSGEGLPIEYAGDGAFEPETVAALAATLAQHAARLGEGAARGELTCAVLDYARGPVVLARAGASDWLALLARPDGDIGPLLYDVRQHGPALAVLL
jgi:predicted regulator of Ras-like GTPase activity (Roadblock/LC7/MglB family)